MITEKSADRDDSLPAESVALAVKNKYHLQEQKKE